MKLTGAEIITEVLIEQGVTDIFGYPGGTVLNVYEALYHRQDKLKHYLTAHEQGATHAADGYARATGKTGVVLVTSGPGATNTVTGIATAYLDSIPMVVITVNVGIEFIGKDSFQEVFITGVTQPITKHNYAVRDISKLAETIREAFRIAGSGRRGPVLIDIPKNITAEHFEYIPAPRWTPAEPKSAPQTELQKVADLVAKSNRPVICFGGGVISSEASEEMLEFVKKSRIPTCHTIMGTGVIGFGDDLDLGMIGMHGSMAANRAIDEADLLLAMGMRFSDRVALNVKDFAPHATVVHFDIDESEIRKNVMAEMAVVGDIKTELRNLIPQVEGKERPKWLETVKKWKGEYDIINGKSITGIRPFEIMDVVGEKGGENAIVVTDVGQHQMWAAQFCKKTRPRGFLTSGGLGTMGFGYGAALGAKVAVPDATVFHITSDGCFHMNMNEVCTAVSNNLKVITVIFDNKVLGMVRQWQTLMYKKHYIATTLERRTDYVKVAEGFGAKGYMAETREEFETAVDAALAGEGPAWIVCPIDPDEKVLPMIPGGGTVRSAIIEQRGGTIMNGKKAIIALLVENNANVLSRVSMLFGRRGYNIDSLTVSETNDPAISRITITTQGDDRVIEQIILQTRKLVEVKAVQLEDENEIILRELLLVKIAAEENMRGAIRDICDVYKASIVDFSPSSIVCELTGKPSKINGFLDIIKQYQILELCRTGVTAIDRGNKIMVCENKESHKC